MNVLALSSDTETLGHVARIFSDQIQNIAPLSQIPQFIDSMESEKWNAFVIDYDLLKLRFPNPLEFLAQMPADSQFVFVGSNSFAEWHDRLRGAGAIVLHKPNTVGEFGIALRKLASSEPGSAKKPCVSSCAAGKPQHAVK